MEQIHYAANGPDDFDAEIIEEGNPLETPEALAEIAQLHENVADAKDKLIAEVMTEFNDWLEELPHAPQVYEIEDWFIEKIKQLV